MLSAKLRFKILKLMYHLIKKNYQKKNFGISGISRAEKRRTDHSFSNNISFHTIINQITEKENHEIGLKFKLSIFF